MFSLRSLPGVALLVSSAPTALAAQGAGGDFAVRAEHRMRFEYLAPDFRAGVGNVTATSLRTLVGVAWSTGPFSVEFEGADSRVYASDGAPLNATHANAFDVLAGHVTVRAPDVTASGDAFTLRAGRLTKDLGSRRLVARNVFRNTINAFTGLEVAWTRPGGMALEAFALVPVTRRPTAAAELADNEIERDRENADALLSGMVAAKTTSAGVALQAYVLGYHERDGDVASANRRVYTPGARIVRAPRAGRFDFQIEAMGQIGTSRASSAPADVTDLSHRAYSAHASLGYRFTGALAPRIALHYDVASGDADPTDAVNQRFDPLFGARAFELGPTGFYGALARSNLSSSAVRLEGAPGGSFDVMVSYRLAWLASARDAWTTAGARDATGDSGRFLGHQLDARVRVRPPVTGLALELGGAALLPGRFARDAGAMDGTTTYFYTQITLSGARS